jgi:hypothetical protein
VRRLLVLLPVVVATAWSGAACGGGSQSAPPLVTLRLNEIQVIGSHNSYHVEPRDLLDALHRSGNTIADPLEYTAAPIADQLGRYGVRQLEFDVDPSGRRLRVLHAAGYDEGTLCPTLRVCVETVEQWSRAHPRHLPIMILLEVKEDPAGPSPDVLRRIDRTLRAAVPAARMLTPDDARGRHPTLAAMVAARDWPTIEAARGKLLFALDNEDELRTLYRQPSATLAGRVMFTSSEPGAADAAFVNMHSPGRAPEIRRLVRAGYLVRARADADTVEARTGSTTHRDAVLRAGAQYVSTDYYRPDPRFGTGYVVRLPGGAVARCNPVVAPPRCGPALLREPGV